MVRPGEAELLADVVTMLRHFSINPTLWPTNYSAHRLGTCDTFVLHVAGVDWMLTANGGELRLDRINSGELGRMVPTTCNGFNLNAATVAHRVACLLLGEPINYDYRLTDEDDEILRRCSSS